MKPATPFPVGILPRQHRQKAAEAWLNAAQWQTFRLVSGRKLASQDGKARTTFTVFAQGCPVYALREVIEMLAAQTPVDDIVVDATVQEGRWHHKTAWWQRDDRAAKNNGDATLTLFRVFSDGDVEEQGIVEDGCGTRVTIRYVFDASGIEDVSADPNHGKQGFAIRIGGVSRDPETGLMSYYVTTTEKLTTHIPRYISGGNAFMTEYTEEWTGLRGTQAAPVTSAGAAVTVPKPAEAAPGTTIDLRWDQDVEDCTWKLRVVERVAKQDVVGRTACDKDLFKEVDVAEVRAQKERLGHAPDADGGVSVQHDSRPREDGLIDNTVITNKEAEVADTRVTVSVGMRTVTTETQDVNRAALPAPADSEVGVTVTNEKTPGKWFRRTKRVVRIRALALLRLVFTEDLFKRETSETRVKEAPDPDPGFAAGGLVKRTDSRLSEDNQWDVTTDADQEKSVQEARKSVSVGLRAIVTDVQDVATIPLMYPTDAEVGSSVVNERTPGGIWRRIYRSVRLRQLAVLRTMFSENLYMKESSVTEVKATPAVDPGFPAGGLVNTVDSRLTEDNQWDVTVNPSQEKTVERSKVRKSRRLGVVTTQVTTTQTPDKSEDLPEGAGGAVLDVEKTKGDLRNRTLITQALENGADGKLLKHVKGGNFRFNYEIEVTLQAAKAFSADVGLTNAGLSTAKLVEETFELGDDEIWRRTREVKVPAGIERNMFGRFVYEDTVYDPEKRKNVVYDVDYAKRQWVNMTVANAEAMIINSQADEDLAHIELGHSFNDFGLLDGHQVREARTLKPV